MLVSLRYMPDIQRELLGRQLNFLRKTWNLSPYKWFLRQGYLHNLWSPVKYENADLFAQKLLRITKQ